MHAMRPKSEFRMPLDDNKTIKNSAYRINPPGIIALTPLMIFLRV